MKDSSGFSALCDLPETFIKKCFESKYIFLNFSLFERFAVEKDVFFAVGENGFPVLCASLRVFFGPVKWMKFYVLLPLVLRMILRVWFSLRKVAIFFASVCEAWLRVCGMKGHFLVSSAHQ